MKKTLPLLAANLLYVVTMLLVITVGSFLQTRNLPWGLAATEVLLIGLPVLLFIRQTHADPKTSLRLNPVRPLTAVLCVALGIAMYFFSLVIEGFMAQLTGMPSVPVSSEMLPRTAPDMAVFFFGLAVLAPLGEEILFRGAIQTAYESRKTPRFAITITALMFAFYHFRLSGLPGLLPIAFVLGFVAWRTNSIWASMLVHFGNNGMSAAQSIFYFETGKALPFVGLESALLGLAAAVSILAVVARLHRAPAPPPAEEPGAPRPWPATYWPLLVAGVLYVGVGVVTLGASLTPKYQAASEATYGFPSVSAPVSSVYAITNKGGQPVGEMACTLRPQGGNVRLDCTRTIRAYEYKAGNSFYKDGNHADTIGVTWDGKTMALVDFTLERKGEEGSYTSSTVKNGTLTTTDSSGADSIALPESGLVEFEWAWHATLLKADWGEAFSMPFARLMMWDESKQKSVPVLRTEIMTVGAEETLALPQGGVATRKLTLANLAAWYAD